MKQLWTIPFVVFVAGALLTGCTRRHTSPYQGVATKMNFGRQVINPKAPSDPRLPQEVAGAVGESIYKRYSDTYGKPIPDCFFQESCTYGSGPSLEEETTTTTMTTPTTTTIPAETSAIPTQ